MPYIRKTWQQYIDERFKELDNRRSGYGAQPDWIIRDLKAKKPPEGNWKEAYCEATTDEAVAAADVDSESVLYADTIEEAEILLAERYPVTTNDVNIRHYVRDTLKPNSGTCLLVFDRAILPDIPHGDEDEEWEVLEEQLKDRGKLWCFIVPDEWKEDGLRQAFGKVVLDLQEHTIEYSPKRVKAMAAGKKAAETRRQRNIPADLWKALYTRASDSFVDAGPLYDVIHSVSWKIRKGRGNLVRLMRTYAKVNGTGYRSWDSYVDLIQAAELALPYLQKSIDKTGNQDEAAFVEWLEEEIAATHEQTENEPEDALV